MTDPALPPEQEAVRGLLAEARHDGPTPPEVVARLDETLASLRAERVPDQTSEQASGARPATPSFAAISCTSRRVSALIAG